MHRQTSEQVCRALSFVGSCHGRALRTLFETSLYLTYLFKSPQTPGRYMRARGVVGHAPLKTLCMVRGGQTLSPTSLLRISSQHILGCDREHIPCQPSSAPFFSNNFYLFFFFFFFKTLSAPQLQAMCPSWDAGRLRDHLRLWDQGVPSLDSRPLEVPP